MEKTLFACDELAGFITACALVKPGKSLAEVAAPSVRKKMKDKAFARSVHREDITVGAADLGLDPEEHIAFCIEAMRGIAKELGLEGSVWSPVFLCTRFAPVFLGANLGLRLIMLTRIHFFLALPPI